MMKKALLVSLVAGFSVGAPLAAQPAAGGAQGQQGPRGRQGQQGQGQQGNRANRDQLQRQIRENFTRRVQAALRLTNDDMIRLAQVNRRFDAERSRLVQEERQVRFEMRRELDASDSTANQARVAELLDRMLRITRSRLDLVEQEQRELATFMTPVQRARYQGMVESLQRRMDDLMDRGRGGPGDGRQGIQRGGPPTRGGGTVPPGASPPVVPPPPR